MFRLGEGGAGLEVCAWTSSLGKRSNVMRGNILRFQQRTKAHAVSRVLQHTHPNEIVTKSHYFAVDSWLISGAGNGAHKSST